MQIKKNKGYKVKITVVGTGYVGLSNAILLAQINIVVALDIDENKDSLLKNKMHPLPTLR